MNHMETKKAFWHAAIAAIAICSFSACASSEEDEIAKSGSGMGTEETIKAQFSISIPMAGGSTTRMSDDVVQKSATNVSDFRGISNICLFPSTVEATSFDGNSEIGATIHLAQLLKPNNVVVNQFIPNGALLSGSKSVLFGDVVMKLGTKTFLFYGKAPEKGSDGPRVNGALETNVGNATTASGFYFRPKKILTSAPTINSDGSITNDATSKRAKILAYLNSIANAEYTDGNNVTTTWKPYHDTDNRNGTKSNTLKSLYNEFITLKAGSSKHLEAAINDLFASVGPKQYPEGWPDYHVAQNIYNAIKNTTYVTTRNDSIFFNDDIKGYPNDVYLPEGAAAIQWNSTEFYYIARSTQLNVADIRQYAYPANLYYWCKSPILTSNELQSSNFTNEMTWDDGDNGIFKKYTDGTEIGQKTRSVILTNPVNYGVARLDISVVAAGTGGPSARLADNGDAWQSTKGVKTRNVSSDSIKLTGVIIGDQKEVDWEFHPTGTDTYAIYDDITVSQDKAGGLAITTSETSTAKNSTLVLESTGGTATDPEKVPIVLEFINIGQDFWGNDGIVPQNCKFYLVGSLDMSKISPTDDKTGGKVFKQDFYTTAKFTIKNLKSAVVTIPDLRNPGVELGLSVDLEWQEGNSFNIDFQ